MYSNSDSIILQCINESNHDNDDSIAGQIINKNKIDNISEANSGEVSPFPLSWDLSQDLDNLTYGPCSPDVGELNEAFCKQQEENLRLGVEVHNFQELQDNSAKQNPEESIDEEFIDLEIRIPLKQHSYPLHLLRGEQLSDIDKNTLDQVIALLRGYTDDDDFSKKNKDTEEGKKNSFINGNLDLDNLSKEDINKSFKDSFMARCNESSLAKIICLLSRKNFLDSHSINVVLLNVLYSGFKNDIGISHFWISFAKNVESIKEKKLYSKCLEYCLDHLYMHADRILDQINGKRIFIEKVLLYLKLARNFQDTAHT